MWAHYSCLVGITFDEALFSVRSADTMETVLSIDNRRAGSILKLGNSRRLSDVIEVVLVLILIEETGVDVFLQASHGAFQNVVEVLLSIGAADLDHFELVG
jgi:hypothetical protein